MERSLEASRAHVAWLDGLKALGIFFVVAGHAFGAACHLSTGLTQQTMETIYKYIYAFHMPLFFVIAGITFRSHLPFGVFLKKKAFRLLVPYFVFGTLSLLAFYLLSEVGLRRLTAEATTTYYASRVGVSYRQMALNLILGGWYPGGYVFNSVLWFIPVLFSLECVFYFIDRRLSQTWMLAIAVVSLPFGWWLRAQADIFLPWGFNLVFLYMPYLVLGRLFGIRVLFQGRWPSRFCQGGALVALAASGVIATLNPWQYETSLGAKCLTMGAACMCIFAWVAVCQAWPFSGRVVSSIGACTMGIMLMHKFPLLFLQNYFPPTRQLFAAPAMVAVSACLMVSAVALAASLLGCAIFRRFCPWALGEQR